MRTVKDLFHAFGGPASVGRIVARGASTASEMKRRGSIPTRYWPALIKAARERGIDLDEAALVRIHLALTKADATAPQAAPHAA